VVITALTAFLGGGLAGAIFNYYVNRPRPTVVIYTVSTTTIAASESAAFIPNLRVALGDETIKSLYVHTVEFTAASGPFVNQLNVAITFPSVPHIYGTHAQSPSPLHAISCSGEADLTCRLSPISTEFGPYRVSIATDSSSAPKPVIAADRVQLLSAQDVATTTRGLFSFIKDPAKLALAAGTLAYLWATSFLAKKIANRSVVVGKVLSSDGRPVSGAEVEVLVESPGKMGRIVQTDGSGDFAIGLRKQAFFSARVRVSHPMFATTEFRTASAIVICKLPIPEEPARSLST
jgi:hypothetical protein